jgi:hypothetical protein
MNTEKSFSEDAAALIALTVVGVWGYSVCKLIDFATTGEIPVSKETEPERCELCRSDLIVGRCYNEACIKTCAYHGVVYAIACPLCVPSGKGRKVVKRGGWQPTRMRGVSQKLLASGSIQPPAPEVEPIIKQDDDTASESKKGKGRALASRNVQTNKMLGFYIKHRDAGASDGIARIKATQDMKPLESRAPKFRESLNRAIERYLSDGDFTELQARKFRKL